MSSEGERDLLAALDPDQRAVAEHLRGPLAVLAGAGTGKTRAITYRIAHGVRQGVFAAPNVLAVTFTSRAAAEMRSRLRSLGVAGVQARTFHSAALRQLRYFWPTAIGGSTPQITEYKARLIGQACARMGLAGDRMLIRDLAAEVEWAKVSLVDYRSYADRAAQTMRDIPGNLAAGEVATLLRVYEEVKTEANMIDFEDVLLLMVGILSENPSLAAEVRSQYRHFVVDEFQDVSPLQYRLLQLWLGDRKDLCVVGDVAQTIYSFTGASARYLTEFPTRFPGAKVVRLTRDYRSTPQVVELANHLMGTDREDSDKPDSTGRTSETGAVRLVAQQGDGPQVEFTSFADPNAEARGAVGQIRQWQADGIALADMAILYRTNSQSEALEDALGRAGIGFQVRGGELFFQRREVKEAMVLVRAALATDGQSPAGEAARNVLSGIGWSENAPSARGAVRERWEGLDALIRLADQLQGADGASLEQFYAELLERAQAQHPPEVQGVTLASLHAAKGLEWEAVMLVGMSKGLMPISLAESRAEIAEEKRLLYVGITRAKTHLTLSYARARSAGGRADRKPTPFLAHKWVRPVTAARQSRTGDAIGVRGRKSAADYGKGGWRLRAREVFEAEAGEEERELFARLQSWRSAVARHVGRPQFIIFPDATLHELALKKPRDMHALARIRGIGPVKVQAFGAMVLAVIRGEDVHPSEYLAEPSE